MNASGVTNSQKYAETKFAIGEYEEELEQRDMTPFAKTTQSLNVPHSEVSCIGSKTCAKQKPQPGVGYPAPRARHESRNTCEYTDVGSTHRASCDARVALKSGRTRIRDPTESAPTTPDRAPCTTRHAMADADLGAVSGSCMAWLRSCSAHMAPHPTATRLPNTLETRRYTHCNGRS